MAKAPKPTFGYKVTISSRQEHSHREEGPYGSWEESYSNSYESIEKTKSYPDVVSLVDLDKGGGFLIWAEWSTGDSFGRSTCGGKEAIALVKHKEDAVKIKEILLTLKNPRVDYEFDPKAKKISSLSFRTKDKQLVELKNPPWLGYFESLEGIHIEIV